MVDKVVVGPFNSVTEPPKTVTKNREKIFGKIHRLLKIIMKLAKIDGYDLNGRIRLSDGSYMERSSLVDLLTHAMSAGRIIIGEDAFIDLLKRANIEPELIINENVRAKLMAAYNNRPTREQEPRLYATPPASLPEPRLQKRTLEEDDDIVELPTKRVRSEDDQSNKRVDDSWWDHPMSRSIPPPQLTRKQYYFRAIILR